MKTETATRNGFTVEMTDGIATVVVEHYTTRAEYDARTAELRARGYITFREMSR